MYTPLTPWVALASGLGVYITRPGPKKDESGFVAAAPYSSSEVMSVFDEGFEAWSVIPGNMDKWTNSLTELE